jgi:CDP-diacylglycerol--glycerol-3-phosphate 3-phosphatidyltransferase
MLEGKTFTASNFLSLLRVLLLFPILQALSKNTLSGNAWALVFIALAVISDFLDGFLARQLGQISELGKVLDPLADKICIIAITWYFTTPARMHPLPLWFLLVVILRDVMVVGTCTIVYRRNGIVLTSNIWGKTTSTVLAAMLIVYILHVENAPAWMSWMTPGLDHFLLWLSLAFLAVSTWSYGRRFYLIMNNPAGRTFQTPAIQSASEPQLDQNGSNHGP